MAHTQPAPAPARLCPVRPAPPPPAGPALHAVAGAGPRLPQAAPQVQAQPDLAGGWHGGAAHHRPGGQGHAAGAGGVEADDRGGQGAERRPGGRGNGAPVVSGMRARLGMKLRVWRQPYMSCPQHAPTPRHNGTLQHTPTGAQDYGSGRAQRLRVGRGAFCWRGAAAGGGLCGDTGGRGRGRGASVPQGGGQGRAGHGGWHTTSVY